MDIRTHGSTARFAGGCGYTPTTLDGGTMTDFTKYRSSYNPWLLGFPLLSATRRTGNLSRLESPRSAGPHPRVPKLTAVGERRRLADAYERLVIRAAESPTLNAPENWRGIRAATPLIARLAQRLREDPEVSAQGVARAEHLLADDAGALYAPHGEQRLVDEVGSTLALL